MEAGNSFTGVTKYLEHFILCKTGLQALVHQVDHLASPTEVHQNEHFPYITATHIVDTGVNVTHDVLVSRQVSHYLDFSFAHLEIMFIIDKHAFQGTFHSIACPHKKHDSKSTFRQHLVHSDLLSPNAKDPSDVATAQARGAAPSSAGAGAQARAALLSPGVEKLLHIANKKQQSKIPTVSRFFVFKENKRSKDSFSNFRSERSHPNPAVGVGAEGGCL